MLALAPTAAVLLVADSGIVSFWRDRDTQPLEIEVFDTMRGLQQVAPRGRRMEAVDREQWRRNSGDCAETV